MVQVRNYDKVKEMLDSFKRHLRITNNDLDGELAQKLLASVAAAEHHIGKVIVESTLTETHRFKTSFALRAPVIVVESVSVDGVGISLDQYSLSGQVMTLDAEGKSVTIVYKAGFDPVPDDMLAAIMLHGAALFNNPIDSVETMPKASDALLRPYRTWGVVDDGE